MIDAAIWITCSCVWRPTHTKYCCIIRFRETIGEGTWNWDSGWSSMRYEPQDATALTMDIDLTVPDSEGHCLNENDHKWGTYTYDFLVLEYTGASPVWIQDNAHDWNFLKRYREGYHLWVPRDLPSPYGDKPATACGPRHRRMAARSSGAITA